MNGADTALLQDATAQGLVRLRDVAAGDHWTGFPTLAGTSDNWVTGFLVAHLAEVAPRSNMLGRNRRFLVSQRSANGGWGYSTQVPADADSTAWCLLALARSRALTVRARREAETFIVDQFDGHGICTYSPNSGIREFVGAGREASIAGWTIAHPDVTAAALLTSAFPRATTQAQTALKWLISTQDRAGALPAYWWRGPYYTSALTLRAFVRHGLNPPDSFIEGIDGLLERKQLEHGGYTLGASFSPDPLSTALALECYAHLGRRGDADRRRATAAALMACQRSDGGWCEALVMRIPAYDITDPSRVRKWAQGTGGGNSFVPDREGLFATVLACYSLTLQRQTEAARYVGLQEDWDELELPAPTVDPTVSIVYNPLPEEAERCNSPFRSLGPDY